MAIKPRPVVNLPTTAGASNPSLIGTSACSRRQPACIRPDMAAHERQNGVTGRPGPTGVHPPGYGGG
jgi:hypothetical protein